MTFRQQAKTLLFKAVDTVLPPRCIVTGEVVAVPGALAPKAWAGLDFIADPCCAACGLPFDFTVGKDPLCAACLAERPAFASARSALKYNDASRSIILGFKHGDQTHAVTTFLSWLRRAGGEMLAAADCIVPVPLHPYRLLARRYNQSALIAFALGKDTGLPVIADALIRVRNTPTQGYLRAKERQDNVRKAFRINEYHKNSITGKTIVLADDVYTTGSTVNECAKTLRDAGAAQVHVLTVARVARADSL